MAANPRLVFGRLFRDAVRISGGLFKIMVPLLILTKICQELGLIEHVGRLLAPVMGWVGLPGSMGLVWATAMVVNIYGAMLTFAALAPENPLTVAQVTVLCSMILVAHTLPVELRVTQKAGPRLRITMLLRVVGAFVLGWGLHRIYKLGDWHQGRSVLLWKAPQQDGSLLSWAWSQLTNLATIFLIIFGLLLIMRILNRLRITDLLTKLLQPLLVLLGIGRESAAITIIGMTLGLSFGGGLIISEAQSGRLGKKDIFFSLMLMNLSHSLIEDTLLMLAMGASVSGVLWGRLIFALSLVFVLVKLVSSLPERVFDRYLFRSAASAG